MTTASPRFRWTLGAFDVLYITGVMMVPFFSWYGLRVAQFGVLPLLAVPFLWRMARPERRDWLLVVLFGQYALLMILNFWLYEPLEGERTSVQDKLVLYGGAVAVLVLVLMRLRLSIDLGSIWRIVAPAVLGTAILLLAWHYASSPECRVGLLTKDLMIPPLWLGVFTIGLFHGWARLTPAERWLRHLLVAGAFVAMTAFLGSRGGFLALCLSVPAAALLLGAGRTIGQRVRVVATLGVASALGLVLGLALDLRADCGFAQRVAAIAETITNVDAVEITETVWSDRLEQAAPTEEGPAPAESATPPSGTAEPAPAESTPPPAVTADAGLIAGVYIRPLLWRAGLEAIGRAPLLGYGYSNEKFLTPGDFPHFHQQYISWLIWGGVVVLASGMVLLLAPLATFGVRRSRDGAILALAMIVPPAVYFLIETYLTHTTTILGYPLVLALYHAMSAPTADAAGSAPSTA